MIWADVSADARILLKVWNITVLYILPPSRPEEVHECNSRMKKRKAPGTDNTSLEAFQAPRACLRIREAPSNMVLKKGSKNDMTEQYILHFLSTGKRTKGADVLEKLPTVITVLRLSDSRTKIMFH